MIQRSDQLVPVSTGSTMLDLFRRANLKQRSDRMSRESLIELAPCEGHRFSSLCARGSIRFVYRDDEILNVLRDCLNQYKLFASQRRIGSNHDQCRINMRDESPCRCRIAGEHRSQPWRVHETHASGKQRTGHKDFQCSDMLRVLRVVLFGEIFIDTLNRNVGPAARGFKAHASGRMASVADDGWDGGDRHNSSRQYAVAHQRIQDRGFPALKLSDTSNVEASLRYSFCHGSRICSDLLGIKRLR